MNRNTQGASAGVNTLNWPLPGDWREHLHVAGTLRIRGVPLHTDNQALRAIAAELGTASLRGLSHRAGLVEAGAVQRVQSLPTRVIDQYAKTLRSAGSAAFALHTDESFCEQPARWVLLHCWQPAAGGGDTLLFEPREIFARISREMRIALEQLRLPYPCGDQITIDCSGRVRFNVGEVEATAARSGAGLSLSQRAWLLRFERLFARHALRLRLAAEDLLIIDNWRVLHGRSAFAADSGRLLKRVRVL